MHFRSQQLSNSFFSPLKHLGKKEFHFQDCCQACFPRTAPFPDSGRVSLGDAVFSRDAVGCINNGVAERSIFKLMERIKTSFAQIQIEQIKKAKLFLFRGIFFVALDSKSHRSLFISFQCILFSISLPFVSRFKNSSCKWACPHHLA